MKAFFWTSWGRWWQRRSVNRAGVSWSVVCLLARQFHLSFARRRRNTSRRYWARLSSGLPLSGDQLSVRRRNRWCGLWRFPCAFDGRGQSCQLFWRCAFPRRQNLVRHSIHSRLGGLDLGVGLFKARGLWPFTIRFRFRFGRGVRGSR